MPLTPEEIANQIAGLSVEIANLKKAGQSEAVAEIKKELNLLKAEMDKRPVPSPAPTPSPAPVPDEGGSSGFWDGRLHV